MSFAGSLRVFVALEACDMRKGANGLHAQVTERLGKDPKTGALFVFTNRRRTRLKILCWDRTVLCSPPLRLPRRGGSGQEKAHLQKAIYTGQLALYLRSARH